MKCPYCNSELLVDRDDIYFKCSGDHCVLGQIWLEKIIFYDLIDKNKTHNALSEAVSCLEYIGRPKATGATCQCARRALKKIKQITGEKEMTETIHSIAQWHIDTFPDATALGQEEKFYDEYREYRKNLDLSELADMFIVAAGMTRFDGVPVMTFFKIILSEAGLGGYTQRILAKAVDEKMAINRARKWNFANGKYQHKES